MSKMKEIYFEMIDAAMNYIGHGLDEQETSHALEKEFGVFFTKYHDDIIGQAKIDLASFHRDMMHSVYSHEENYGQ
jgi:hypothetical protein